MNRSLSSISQTLTESLELTLPPIAVCLSDTVPSGVRMYSKAAPAGCLFWQEAANGPFATTAADHAHCAIGMYTHHLARTPSEDAELGAALKVFAELGYIRAEDVPRIPVVGHSSKHVIYAPLAMSPLSPDVVLLFVRADQTLVLAEATEAIDGGLAPAMGRPACAVVPQAKNSGGAALSLGCCGARAYLDALTPDVALYALPGAKLDAYATRIAELAKANGVLGKFHQLRRKDIEAGKKPTIADSLAVLASAR